MEYLQLALMQFNTDIPNWYKWIDTGNGMIYSNVQLNDENAVMPTEEEVNKKIAELQWEDNRKINYPQLGQQFDKLFHDIDNGTLDNTGEFFTALKEVKDAYPKEDE